MEQLSGTLPLGKYLFRVTNRDVKKSTGEYIFKFINKSDLLTHFLPMLHLYTPWKHDYDFLMFSRGMEMQHSGQIG